MRESGLRWTFIIGLLLSVFLDGTISQQFAGHLFRSSATAVPEITTLWLLCASFFEDQYHMPTYWFAVFAGVVFDLFYSGYWGVYLFIFPVIVWLARTLRQVLPVNLFATLLVGFLGFTIQPLLSWSALQMIGGTGTSVADFMVIDLAPTLALNEVILLILYVPLRQLYLRGARVQ